MTVPKRPKTIPKLLKELRVKLNEVYNIAEAIEDQFDVISFDQEMKGLKKSDLINLPSKRGKKK
jgi:hypothetical protein